MTNEKLKLIKNPSVEKQKIESPQCGYYLSNIYFYLTEGCNLKCRHCWIAPQYEKGTEKELKYPFLDFDLFKSIIRQGKELGLSSVKLTGGEPLIHPNIMEIIEYVIDSNLKLTIETNGIECTPKIVEKIASSVNPFVSVSVDGAKKETHEWVRGVNGSFENAIRGIRNLVNAKIKTQVIMSVMKYNVNEMHDVIKLAEREGCESIKFNLVTPTERGKRMEERGETLSIDELVKTGEWIEKEMEKITNIRIFYSHPVAFRPLGRLFTSSNGRCGIKNLIGVLGSGKYALCGIGESVQELIFGDAREDKLADVWNNNEILNSIRKSLPYNLKGVCANCLMKNICLGSCVAMNYYRSKDLFAPFWYCARAHDAKLFPTTRLKPDAHGKSNE